jgi:hypothetical protein
MVLEFCRPIELGGLQLWTGRSKSFMNGDFKSEAGADGCRWYDVVTERRDQDGLCRLRREEVWKR